MCLHFWPYSWKQSLCFSSIVKHRYGKSHKPAAPTRRQISQVNLTGSCSCCRVLSWVSRGGCDPLAAGGPADAASTWSPLECGSAAPPSPTPTALPGVFVHRSGTGGSSDRVCGVCARCVSPCFNLFAVYFRISFTCRSAFCTDLCYVFQQDCKVFPFGN